jgi:hypothetical protein
VVLVDRLTVLAEEVAGGLRSNGTETKVCEVDVRGAKGGEQNGGIVRLSGLHPQCLIIVRCPSRGDRSRRHQLCLGVNICGVTMGCRLRIPSRGDSFGYIINTAFIAGLMANGKGLWRQRL